MNTEELTAAIADEFQRLLQAPSFSAMRRRAAKDVTFAASQEYADAIGETLAKACRKYITDDIASEKMTKELAHNIIGDNLARGNDLVRAVCGEAQKQMYTDMGTQLNPIVPDFDTDRADGLVKVASDAEAFTNVQDEIYENLSTFLMHTVDETVRRNADFLRNAGAEVAVIRSPDAGACKWCRSIASGSPWRGHDIPPEAYMRHRRCKCRVYYKAAFSKTLDIQTQYGWFEESNTTIEGRKLHGLE